MSGIWIRDKKHGKVSHPSREGCKAREKHREIKWPTQKILIHDFQRNNWQDQKALETSKITRKETCLGQTKQRIIVQWLACTWQHNIKKDFTEIKKQKTAHLWTYKTKIVIIIIIIIIISSVPRSYWMTLRKGEDTLIWRRKLWIALCGELALQEALDLS